MLRKTPQEAASCTRHPAQYVRMSGSGGMTLQVWAHMGWGASHS